MVLEDSAEEANIIGHGIDSVLGQAGKGNISWRKDRERARARQGLHQIGLSQEVDQRVEVACSNGCLGDVLLLGQASLGMEDNKTYLRMLG